MVSDNVAQLIDFINGFPVGTKLNIATSQYATNTIRKGFRFDFHSTAQAVRSLIKSGMIDGWCGWRYYEITVKRSAYKSVEERARELQNELSTVELRDLIDELCDLYEPTQDMIDDGESLYPLAMVEERGMKPRKEYRK